jgi:hypothetical protein
LHLITGPLRNSGIRNSGIQKQRLAEKLF